MEVRIASITLCADSRRVFLDVRIENWRLVICRIELARSRGRHELRMPATEDVLLTPCKTVYFDDFQTEMDFQSKIHQALEKDFHDVMTFLFDRLEGKNSHGNI